MMLGFLGQPSEVSVFRYQLCDFLKKTPAEIDEMSYEDFINLAAFYKAKNAIENKKEVGS